MDRRAFVKGCIAAAGVGAAAATGMGLAWPSVIVRKAPAAPVAYYGFHKVGGPAPRGSPLIPVRVNADGVFEGIHDAVGPDGQAVLDWYKYCGHAAAPGLTAAYNGDSVLRYFIAEDKLKQGVAVWYKDRLGEPIKPEHFEPGFGAGFVWRSEGQTGPNILTGAIIRAPTETAWTPEDAAFAPSRFVPPAKAIKDAEWEDVRTKFLALTEKGRFVAVSTFCPHFCCLPGWKEAPKLASSVADPVNGGTAAERMFCTCHFSVYHPFQLAKYVFQPEVVSGESGSSGGGGH